MNQIIDKIRKLMMHSESARELGSIAEAEAFASKAQKLLAEHNLSKADITVEEAKKEVVHVSMPAKVKGVGGRSAFNIMAVIAEFNWCKAYTMGNASHNKMIIVGSPENIEVCEYIHTQVTNALVAVGKRDYKKYKDDFEPDWTRDKPVGQDTFLRTFLAGASSGLREKLRSEREEFVKQNESSTAIIRTNDIVISDYVTETWGGTGTGRRQSYNHEAGAYGAGRTAGKNVSVHKGVNGGSKPITRKRLG